MIDARITSGASFLVVGAVRGLASEADRLTGKLDGFRPGALALALSPDELRGIQEYFDGTPTEPLVPLTGNELAEIRGLARYGEVRVPNPSWTAALAWGRAHRTPVEGVDPSDESYAMMFTHHIGYTELVRRTLRERSLTRRPPAPATADDFAIEWARRLAPGAGSARLAHRRDEAVVAGARNLALRTDRVALVVDRERFQGVVAVFGQTPGAIGPAETAGSVRLRVRGSG